MALARCEGFDGVASVAELTTNRGCTFLLSSGTGMKYSAAGGRNGGGAVYGDVPSSSNSRGIYFPFNSGPGVVAIADLVIGFAFKIVRGTFNPISVTTTHKLIGLYSNGGIEVGGINLAKSGSTWQIQYITGAVFRTGATFIGDPVGAHYFPDDNRWYYVEVKLSDLTTTATSTASIYIDGVLRATAGSLVTSSSSSIVGYIGLNFHDSSGTLASVSSSTSLATSEQLWFDDIYVASLTGDYPVDVLGDVSVGYWPALAEGTYTDFDPSTGTDRAALVDDSTPDGDTTYVRGTTTGDKVTFTLDPPADIPYAIHAVQPHAVIRRAGDYSRVARMTARVNSTDYDGSSLSTHLVSPPLANYVGIWEPTYVDANPNTVAQWLYADLVSAQFGLKVES